MSFANSIQIGPEFFAKAKNDYADFTWAITREFFQNSIDAPGSSRVDVSVHSFDNEGVMTTMLTVENNGAPMTREILEGKLLSLGGSGKGFEGTVGGFGKAKEILYFCHKSYKIWSGGLTVEGSGAGYNLVEGEEFVAGTRSTILITGDYAAKLVEAVGKFAKFAQWDGEIFLNAVKLDCSQRKGSPRKEFSWGTVYTNKAAENVVVVRVGGIPMFIEHTPLDRCVIIELKGASVEVLTSNRDSLVWTHRQEYRQFLLDLVTNKSRALKAPEPTYQHFGGVKYVHRVPTASRTTATALVGDVGVRGGKSTLVVVDDRQELPEGVDGSFDGFVFSGSRVGVMDAPRTDFDSSGQREILGWTEEAPVSPVSVLQEEFVIKNETTLKIPAYLLPDSDTFGSYGKKLARIWGRLMLELHRMYKLETEFAIGFVFSEDAEAQHEVTAAYGTVYYLNPVEVVEQKASTSKSMRKRFALTERNRILAIAVHEFLHGLGYDSHDERYAARLTEVFGEVMDERKRFNWAFA